MIEVVRNNWLGKAADRSHIELVVVVDADDHASIEVCKQLEWPEGIHWHIQESMPGNCVKGWNLAAEHSHGKVLAAVSDDFDCPMHWDMHLLSLKPRTWISSDCVVRVNDGFVRNLCTLPFMTRVRYEKLGYFYYPGYESVFCNTSDTIIYMADQSFKKLADICVGDVVVGTIRDVRPPRFPSSKPSAQKRLRLAPSKVLDKLVRMANCVEVTLKSGRKLKCTSDHLWAHYLDRKSRGHGSLVDWRTPDADVPYSIPEIGKNFVHVIDKPQDPPPGSERELGWLGGIFDGEGHWMGGPGISQSETENALVVSEINRILIKYHFQNRPFPDGETGQITWRLLGGRQEWCRFLNWARPTKIPLRDIYTKMLVSRFGTPDAVVKIGPIGLQEVVSLKTETRNYVAGGFLSHNCDTELTEHAIMDGALLDASHLLFQHHHSDNGRRQTDAVDAVHNSKWRWSRGQMLFDLRKERSFPVDQGKNAVIPDINEMDVETVTPEDMAVYIQATKDDFCLKEVCDRLIEEGLRNFFFCVPDTYWSGRPTPTKHIAEVQCVYDYLVTVPGVNPHFKLFHVDDYRAPDRPRIIVETYLRNDSLRWMKQCGFHHIIIVDGDELWVPGLLDKLRDTIVDTGAAAIACSMIPVVGLPGYPIDRAEDKVTIYVDAKRTEFRNCRSPFCDTTYMPEYGVVHFTACRATMEEIKRKHLDSGHADDPDYDMKGWCENILPNVKPGMKNVHMYKKFQIWPEARNWRRDELDWIPTRLHQFLGTEFVQPNGQTAVAPPSVLNMTTQLRSTNMTMLASPSLEPPGPKRHVV